MAQQPSADDAEEIVGPALAALLGILLTGLLYLLLPTNVIIGPNWLLLVIEGVFVIPLLIDILTPWDLSHTARRVLVLVPLSLSTLALVVGVALFVSTLATNTNANNLLRAGALLWVFNILVFALWYWEIDGGGPEKRRQSGHQTPDFLFPQQMEGHVGNWEPHFFDYLYVAFTGATAFSPTDTMPLSRRAKFLMMVEAILALIIISFVVSRAINII